jgi:peptidoglycan/xylan/chitin deacetylase (PgdA/CDA1 family)
MVMIDGVQRAWLRTLGRVPVVPRWLRRQFPEVLWAGDPRRREVALSFDDGPHPRDTPQLLEVLARHGIPATFCLLGERVEALLALVSALAAAGHHLGMHGYRHRSFLLEAPSVLHEQLRFTQALIGKLAGRSPTTIQDVRPPYGIFTPALLDRLVCWGYRPLIGRIVPNQLLAFEQLLALGLAGSGGTEHFTVAARREPASRSEASSAARASSASAWANGPKVVLLCSVSSSSTRFSQ